MEQGTLVGTILAWFMLLFAMTFDFCDVYRKSRKRCLLLGHPVANDRFWRNNRLHIYFTSYGRRKGFFGNHR